MNENAVLQEFDVVVVGGGPAGMTAAIWCADLGLTCCVLESGPALGGQLHWIHAPIKNYPGILAENGVDLLRRFESSLPIPIAVELNARVSSIDVETLSVTLESGLVKRGRAIVLATGISRRKLGVAGENEFVGRGILDSGSRARNEVAGKRVVIIGGGDAAFENVTILSKTAEMVTLIHRRPEFTARAEFLDAVNPLSNVEIVTAAELISINGDQVVNSVTYRHLAGSEHHTVEADAVLIRVGVKPNSELVAPFADRDDRGYVLVDRNCMSSAKNIFAIGDVSNPTAPTIASATGDAANAVKSALRLLRSNA